MKAVIASVICAVAGFAAAFMFVKRDAQPDFSKERAELEAKWQAEKADLEKRLRNRQSFTALSVDSPGSDSQAGITPDEIIEELSNLRPQGKERNRIYRRIIYLMETLAAHRNDAIPSISGFLARNQDIDYSQRDEEGENRERRGDRPQFERGGGRRAITRGDSLVPMSLRLGLFDVLKQIGGQQSEDLLASVLSSTGRGMEVAYLARILQDMAPDKYRNTAITAAKDLLANPLEPNAKQYLYAVLEMYNDTSFTDQAKGMLVGADGRIDRDALDYLTRTMKEQSVEALMAAYNNPSITNQFDKMNLANQALNYVGQNDQANQLLNDLVTNTNMDRRMRSMALMRTIGGPGDFGPFGGGGGEQQPVDPAILQKKLQVVQAVAQGLSANDQRMQTMAAGVATALQAQINGEKVSRETLFGLLREERGERGRRGGGR